MHPVPGLPVRTVSFPPSPRRASTIGGRELLKGSAGGEKRFRCTSIINERSTSSRFSALSPIFDERCTPKRTVEASGPSRSGASCATGHLPRRTSVSIAAELSINFFDATRIDKTFGLTENSQKCVLHFGATKTIDRYVCGDECERCSRGIRATEPSGVGGKETRPPGG